MGKTIVVYGSTTGTCEAVAESIASKLGTQATAVSDFNTAMAEEAQNLILGTSTWGAGELQDDWYDGVEVLKSANLEGKTAALFGCGDSESYPDTFCGGMAELYDALQGKGVRIIGAVPTDGYNFSESEAVKNGNFVGLAIDDVNESDKTEERISAWVETLKKELA